MACGKPAVEAAVAALRRKLDALALLPQMDRLRGRAKHEEQLSQQEHLLEEVHPLEEDAAQLK